LAIGGPRLRLPNFVLRRRPLFLLSYSFQFPMQNRVLVSPAFGIEEPRSLLERGDLTFCRTDSVVINGDHRCDHIAFAA